MPKFIIGYGLAEHTDVIEAPNLDAALNEAVGRSALDNIEDANDGDWSWAIPYSEDQAWDLGLLDPPRNETRMSWWG